MAAMTLVIGNKNYSSWSLRPWLFMRHHGLPFEERRLALYTEKGTARLREISPSGLLPVLKNGPLVIWDSLAILEYLAEAFPQTQGWPAAPEARALARAASAEMHAGYRELRSVCTMNIRARYKWKNGNPALAQEISRIERVWLDCRSRYGSRGPWLFGEFSIADAMFAPVAFRFTSYNVPLGPVARDYVATVLGHSAVQEWVRAALHERETIAAYEHSDWERI